MGKHATARAHHNTINDFNYKPNDFLQQLRQNSTFSVKLDKNQKARIADIEIAHYKQKYMRKQKSKLTND